MGVVKLAQYWFNIIGSMIVIDRPTLSKFHILHGKVLGFLPLQFTSQFPAYILVSIT